MDTKRRRRFSLRKEREKERQKNPFAHEVRVADAIAENGTELSIFFAGVF